MSNILTKHNLEHDGQIIKGNKTSYSLIQKNDSVRYEDYRFYDVSDYIRTNYSEQILKSLKKENATEKIKIKEINNAIAEILDDLEDLGQEYYLDYFVGVYELKKNDEDANVDLIIEKKEIITYKKIKIEIPFLFSNANFRLPISLKVNSVLKKYVEFNSLQIIYDIENVRLKDKVNREESKNEMADMNKLIDMGLSKSISQQMNIIQWMNQGTNFLSFINIAGGFIKLGENGVEETAEFSFKKGIKQYAKKRAKKIPGQVVANGMSAYILWNVLDDEELQKSIINIKEKYKDFRFKDIKTFLKFVFHEVVINESELFKKSDLDKFIDNITDKSSHKKNRINKNVLENNLDNDDNLETFMVAIMMEGLFEEKLKNMLTNFSMKTILENYFTLKKAREDFSNSCKPLFIDDDNLSNFLKSKVKEFFVVWIPSFFRIKVLNDDDADFRKLTLEQKLKKFIEIADEYKKVSKISQTLTSVGLLIKTSSEFMRVAISSAAAASAVLTFVTGGAALAVTAASIAIFTILKYVGLSIVLHAHDIAEAIVLDEKDLSEIIPFISILPTNKEITVYNSVLKILETTVFDKKWVKKINSYFHKIENGEFFNVDGKEIEEKEALKEIVDVKCCLEAFEDYYIDKKISNYMVYPDKNYKSEMEKILIDANSNTKKYVKLEKEKGGINAVKNILEDKNYSLKAKKEPKELEYLKRMQKYLKSKESISEEDIRNYKKVINNTSKYTITKKDAKSFSMFDDKIISIYVDYIYNFKDMLEDLKKNYSKFYNEIFIKEFESINFKEIYSGNSYKPFTMNINTKEGNYIMLRLDIESGDEIDDLQEYKDKKFKTYKEIFSYTKNQYYIDNDLVGSIKNENDFDYILVKNYVLQSDRTEKKVKSSVIKIIDSTKFEYVTLNGSINATKDSSSEGDIYDIADIKVERKMQKLYGLGTLTYKNKVLGKDLIFFENDDKHFWDSKFLWENGQEYNFKVYKDKNDFKYFYNMEYNYLKIKNDGDTILVVENFAKTDYGIFEDSKNDKIDEKEIEKDKMDIPSYNFFIKYNEKYGLIKSYIQPYYYVEELYNENKKVCIGDLAYKLIVSETNRISEMNDKKNSNKFKKIQIQCQHILDEVCKTYKKENYESENGYFWTKSGNQKRLISEAKKLKLNNLLEYVESYSDQINEKGENLEKLEKNMKDEKEKGLIETLMNDVGNLFEFSLFENNNQEGKNSSVGRTNNLQSGPLSDNQSDENNQSNNQNSNSELILETDDEVLRRVGNGKFISSKTAKEGTIITIKEAYNLGLITNLDNYRSKIKQSC